MLCNLSSLSMGVYVDIRFFSEWRLISAKKSSIRLQQTVVHIQPDQRLYGRSRYVGADHAKAAPVADGAVYTIYHSSEGELFPAMALRRLSL